MAAQVNQSVRFSAMPPVPQKNIAGDLVSILTSIKENIELLTGTRGDAGVGRRAILYGQIAGVAEVAAPNLIALSSTAGSGVLTTITIGSSTVTVPASGPFVNLLSDVYKLSTDVANIRTTLNDLIKALKGQ